MVKFMMKVIQIRKVITLKNLETKQEKVAHM